jgi:hypothetical protein
LPRGKKRRSRTTAPAVVYFTEALNEEGRRQLCVYAECAYGGVRVGPVWSHADASVRRALATLTKHCDCGRLFHRRRFTEGRRVLPRSV